MKKLTAATVAAAGLLAGCSAEATRPATTTTVTTTTGASTPSQAEAAAPSSPSRIAKQIGQEMGIYPTAQGSSSGPGTATGTITEIKKAKSRFTGDFALRVSAKVRTGNDDETNASAMDLWWCGSPSWTTVDPDTGEQVSGHGGFMVEGDNHIVTFARDKTYSCTFDVDGLATHGLLVLGGVTAPSSYSIPFDVR
ncbi:hypothetical protein OHS18_22540 [Amycolatopsis sp. NBC_00355]|uniref:hypothetical protein n=1 Tax=Amycolatopsis sp. NBC_00355 TaxID=2975957 RepID=UPI002E26F064